MANEFYKELIDNERTFRNNLGWSGTEVSGNSFYLELIALRAQIATLWNLIGIVDGQVPKWNNSTKKFVPGDFAPLSHTHSYLAIASNLSDLGNTATARSNLGLGTAATASSSSFLAVANNLSDLGNAGTARGNLGMGATGAAGYFWAGPTGAGGTASFRAIAAADLPSNVVYNDTATTFSQKITFNSGQVAKVANSASGSSLSLDLASASFFPISLTANTALSFSNAAAGTTFQIDVTQDATGNRTLTMPANGKLIGGGSINNTANKVSVVSGYFIDAINYRYSIAKE